jgi:DNA processing protein
MNQKYSTKICWLWLVMSLGVANKKIWKYLNEYKTIEETCRFVLSNVQNKKIVSVDSTKVFLVNCLRKGIQVVCYADPEYPKALRTIENPPAVLFCKGNLNLLNHEKLLTVVGTRNPSDYTIKVTTEICNGLLDNGFMFVSGLAVGVDSISHKCSVDRNIPTIAVTACGIEHEYPKANTDLRKKIIQQGGLILTEQFPEDKPLSWNFPKRNRILANLSTATLITEAGSESGALITANHAYANGKTIFALAPPNVFCKSYDGLISCIRNGAICTFSHADIVYEYTGEYPLRVRRTDIVDFRNGKTISESPIFKENTFEHISSGDGNSYIDDTTIDTTTKDTKAKSKAKTKTKTPKAKSVDKPKVTKDIQVPLNEKQSLVVESIRNGCTCLDDISRTTKIPISELFEIATELEMDGILKSGFGNVYTLN